ncbi:MAG: glycerophosphodiester phosphodiesterase family protein [Bacteroidota bacterium]|nr:glycerophosphodiester phosphodiesterase family protein [Bacteroidota bacterium]
MRKKFWLITITAGLLSSLPSCKNPSQTVGQGLGETYSQFHYTGDGSILVSGHRGAWKNTQFPDNSLEGLQYATERVPGIFFEIDPRLTKDSVIILMHDETLDRTTNATGKVSESTFEELKEVRLRDYKGDITDYRIPTLEEVIRWSRGKTILNLDRKDVPLEATVALIKRCGAEEHIMLTVHTGAQARFYHDRLPNTMLSAWVRNDREYEDIAISGVPWSHIIAYVGPTINEGNRHIVEKLHGHGVRCMVGLSPTHDRLESKEERALGYLEEIKKKPDIIETDLPVELYEVLTNR